MDDFNKRYQEMFQIGITPEMKGVKINAEYIKQREQEHDRIWNAAIEAAAKAIAGRFDNHGWNYHLPSVGREVEAEIRKLKK